jgi:hypothetical protein
VLGYEVVEVIHYVHVGRGKSDKAIRMIINRVVVMCVCVLDSL